MENTSAIKLQPTITTITTTCSRDIEFDPVSNAKPCSPFYLYNHDSPRPSTDARPKVSPNVSVRDLEAASDTLTPSVTLEKVCTKPPQSKFGAFKDRLMPSRCQQMTKPKNQSWLKSMPKKQRRWTKAFIALVIVCLMVGIAVGVAAGVKSTVWKGNNQQGEIHS